MTDKDGQNVGTKRTFERVVRNGADFVFTGNGIGPNEFVRSVGDCGELVGAFHETNARDGADVWFTNLRTENDRFTQIKRLVRRRSEEAREGLGGDHMDLEGGVDFGRISREGRGFGP